MGRAPCCEKVGLKRGRWTAEEDEILINYIKQNGEGSWRSLPKNAGLLRCGKSCRLRWINYLRADLKRGNFTREEEEAIIKWHKSVGNKWSFIASKLPGRTDNEVKNYWNSHLSRKIYSFRSSTGSMVTTLDMVKMASTCKRKGGRVSRAVAKKYNTNPISKTTTTTTSSSSTKLQIGEISGIKEATTAGNAGVGLSKTRSEMPESRTAENAQGGLGTVEEWGKYHLKPADIYDHVEKGSINSIHEYMCDGLERCPDISMPSPEKLEEENDVLGPNNAPDDVTLLVEKFLESELMDLSEISVDSGMRLNESMDPESGLINKETDCGGTRSKLNSDTADLYQCFSPLNSGFSHELITWDTEYAIPGFELWDQGDDILWLQ